MRSLRTDRSLRELRPAGSLIPRIARRLPGYARRGRDHAGVVDPIESDGHADRAAMDCDAAQRPLRRAARFWLSGRPHDAPARPAGPALEDDGKPLMIWAGRLFAVRCKGISARALIYTQCAEFQKRFMQNIQIGRFHSATSDAADR